MKVLVIGAGIAGNSLAYWLSKLGHDVTVIERFPELRTSGLQIDLRGQGIEVIKRMGLEQAIRSKSVAEEGLQFVDKSGKRIGFFPVNKSGSGTQSFTSDYEIMRSDLCRVLHDAAVGKGSCFEFGKSVENFESQSGVVHVKFSDGQEAKFDLVVGADGQWSRTRKMMLGPDAQDPFHPIPGQHIAYFSIPRPVKDGERYTATIYVAPGGRGVMTRRSNPDELQVYLGCESKDEKLKNVRRGDIETEQAILTELTKGAGWEVDEYLDKMKVSKNFYCERLGIVEMKSWSSGQVTLLGDAAYCPSVNTGMGTTSAIVGAYVLAGEIAKHCSGKVSKDDTTAALQGYEKTFMPFMSKVQEGVLDYEGALPSGRLGIAMLNAFISLASFAKINIGKYMIREGSVKGWSLPEYKELL